MCQLNPVEPLSKPGLPGRREPGTPARFIPRQYPHSRRCAADSAYSAQMARALVRYRRLHQKRIIDQTSAVTPPTSNHSDWPVCDDHEPSWQAGCPASRQFTTNPKPCDSSLGKGFQKVPQHLVTLFSQNGFRVKLHPLDRQCLVPHAHDLAIFRPSGDLQAIRQAFTLNH